MNGLLKSLRSVFRRDPLDEAFNEVIVIQKRIEYEALERDAMARIARERKENEEARQRFIDSIDIYNGLPEMYAAEINHAVTTLRKYADTSLSIMMQDDRRTGFGRHIFHGVYDINWRDLERNGLIAIVNAQYKPKGIFSCARYVGTPVKRYDFHDFLLNRQSIRGPPKYYR
jgi:hypothetical protein